MLNKIPIKRFWEEYKAYSLQKSYPTQKDFLESSLIRVMCWYRKRILLNLWWLIPVCLFVGWTIGFWVGIPNHITFSSDNSLIELIDYTELRIKNTSAYLIDNMPNCSRVNYNITSYNTYDTGSYAKLLSELSRCNANRELAFGILEQCKDKSWCDCEENTPRNPIIEYAIRGNSSNKRFCIWKPFQDRNCDFTEMDIRNLISHMSIGTEIEVMRWEDVR